MFDLGSYVCDGCSKSVAILARRSISKLENLKNGDPTNYFNKHGLLTDYVLNVEHVAIDNSLFDHIVMVFKPNSKMMLRNLSGRLVLQIDQYEFLVGVSKSSSTPVYTNVGLYN
jgi:hypothetical protein